MSAKDCASQNMVDNAPAKDANPSDETMTWGMGHVWKKYEYMPNRFLQCDGGGGGEK